MDVEDVTVEYKDDLTASFTCTAFGGDNEELVFTWITPNDATNFDTDTQVETLNADNTITSTITTLPLSLSDRMQVYACDVAYDGFPDRDDESFATLNIGKIITIYHIYLNYNFFHSASYYNEPSEYICRGWVGKKCYIQLQCIWWTS